MRAYSMRKWGYDLHLIADTHGTVCYLCGDEVNIDTARGPAAPCVDHVLPVAAGGSNDIDNLRVVHLRCNLKKGDRLFCVNCGHSLGLRF